MAFALAGAPNAVATCGTALADDHFQILKNLARKVTLAYDSDAAGQGAAEKWYGWEQRYEIELRVADLPLGRDPGDLWRDDRPALTKALEGAKPFMQFRIDRALAGADRTSPEGRARAAEALVPVLREHPNELVREGYIQTVAGTLGIDHAWFKTALSQPAARSGPSGPPQPEPERRREARPVDPRELDVLRWTIHQPEMVLDWLDPALFTDPTARTAAEVLIAHDDFRAALEASTDDVRGLLERLAVEEPSVGEDAEAVRALLMVRTVEPAARRVLARLLEDGDERTMQATPLLSELVHARENSEWERAQEAARQLVGWLAETEGPAAPE